MSIIYISHKMEEIFRIADDITVLRDGQVVTSKRRAELNIETVINLMVGRKLDSSKYPKEHVQLGEVKLEVKGLTCYGVFNNINFSVRAGEIVGFAGLVGAGRTEVMRAVFGLDLFDEGDIVVHGESVNMRSTRDGIKHKMAMLPEDRRRHGIVSMRSVKENAVLASLKKFFYKLHLHAFEEKKSVTEMFARMNVKTPSLETRIEALSGGNQQKVLFAKWMLSHPEILILDEPTRGIDVGAKFEIYKLMTDMAKEGKALVMISSELPELIGMCDRIYVMADGQVAGELQRAEFSQENIMRFATAMRQQKVGA